MYKVAYNGNTVLKYKYLNILLKQITLVNIFGYFPPLTTTTTTTTTSLLLNTFQWTNNGRRPGTCTDTVVSAAEHVGAKFSQELK